MIKCCGITDINVDLLNADSDDFTEIATSLEFPSYVESRGITIYAVDDNDVEFDEYFFLELEDPQFPVSCKNLCKSYFIVVCIEDNDGKGLCLVTLHHQIV